MYACRRNLCCNTFESIFMPRTDVFSSFDAFTDGFGLRPMNPMSPEWIGDAQGYLNFKRSLPGPCNEAVVVHAARLSVIKIQAAFDWINSDLLDDTPLFFAQMQPVKDFPSRVCTIYVGLGCVPIFVGITNRLHHMRESGPLTLAMESQGTGAFGKKWDPIEDPVGTLTFEYGRVPNTSTYTADAMLLLLFHEATHALRGHSWISRSISVHPDDHNRALETDADWGAGYLFVKYELQMASKNSALKEADLAEIVSRLVLASTALLFALQIHSNTATTQYHLPYCRATDIFHGAEVAWREHGGLADFIKLRDGSIGHLGIIDQIVGHNLSGWVEHGSTRHELDENAKLTITQSIVHGFHDQASIVERGPIVGGRDSWRKIRKLTDRMKMHRVSSPPSVKANLKLVWTQAF
jgi:hypothetical protein